MSPRARETRSVSARLARVALALASQLRRAAGRCRRKCTDRSVHAFRVDVRRLLAGLDLLAPLLPAPELRRLQRGLKKRLRVTAKLRDLQVQECRAGMQAHLDPGWREFQRHLRRHRRRLMRRTAGRLRPGRLVRRLIPVEAALARFAADGRGDDRLVRQAVALVLERNSARLILAMSEARAAPEKLHRARLALKRLRYVVEFLRTAGLAVAGGELGNLRSGQTLLGDIHDLVLTEAHLDKFEGRRGANAATPPAARAPLARDRARLARRCRKFLSGEAPALRFHGQVLQSECQGLHSFRPVGG